MFGFEYILEIIANDTLNTVPGCMKFPLPHHTQIRWMISPVFVTIDTLNFSTLTHICHWFRNPENRCIHIDA
jgi:hypothetical protein